MSNALDFPFDPIEQPSPQRPVRNRRQREFLHCLNRLLWKGLWVLEPTGGINPR
jgi:hypothetical protein